MTIVELPSQDLHHIIRAAYPRNSPDPDVIRMTMRRVTYRDNPSPEDVIEEVVMLPELLRLNPAEVLGNVKRHERYWKFEQFF